MSCNLVSIMINNISPHNFVEMLRKQESDIIPITCEDEYGNTALHYAVKQQHHELVLELILYAQKFFPNHDLINAQNRDGDTPLHLAVSCYGNISNKIADILYQHGAKENIPNNYNIVIKMTRSAEKAVTKQIECHEQGIEGDDGDVIFKLPTPSDLGVYINSLEMQPKHQIRLPYDSLTEQFPTEIKINNIPHDQHYSRSFY